MLNAIEEACSDKYKRLLNDNIQYFCKQNVMLICGLQLIFLYRFEACPVLPIQMNVSVSLSLCLQFEESSKALSVLLLD